MPSRVGSRRAFRYLDGRGREIRDPVVLDRIDQLAIPPAWKDVWIAAGPGAKLQATGYDKAGRKQYIYRASYRAAQEEAKYDRLIRFGERLPELRAAMSCDDELCNLTSKQLNDYVKIYLGEEFTAKDFRTWGGTLLAAIYLAERADTQGFPDSETKQKRSITSVMRRVADQLGNTSAVTRES